MSEWQVRYWLGLPHRVDSADRIWAYNLEGTFYFIEVSFENDRVASLWRGSNVPFLSIDTDP